MQEWIQFNTDVCSDRCILDLWQTVITSNPLVASTLCYRL
jgi:hypothetical protein